MTERFAKRRRKRRHHDIDSIPRKITDVFFLQRTRVSIDDHAEGSYSGFRNLVGEEMRFF